MRRWFIIPVCTTLNIYFWGEGMSGKIPDCQSYLQKLQQEILMILPCCDCKRYTYQSLLRIWYKKVFHALWRRCSHSKFLGSSRFHDRNEYKLWCMKPSHCSPLIITMFFSDLMSLLILPIMLSSSWGLYTFQNNFFLIS